jgi:hypothetical protein
MKNKMTHLFSPAVILAFENKRWRSFMLPFRTNAFSCLITSIPAFVLLLTACAEKPAISKGEQHFQCTIEGRQITFLGNIKSAFNENDAFRIRGMSNPLKMGEHLSLLLPKLKKGTYTLEDTPGMRLEYSRSLLSSNSEDYFGADTHLSGSQLKVTISYLNLKEGWVEGTFSGTVQATPSKTATSIKDGIFRLPINEKQQSNNVPTRQTDLLKAHLISENAFALTLEPIPRDGIITEFRLTYY